MVRDRREYNREYYQEHKEQCRVYKATYRAKHRVALRKRGRERYHRTKAATIAKHKVYRSRPDVKEKLQEQFRTRNVRHRVRNTCYYQKQRIKRQKCKKKKTPGFLYFFESITPGYYKAGCTSNWERRNRAYSGPAAIKRLFILRPVPDKYYAETQLKIFLENAGYKPAQGRICDWFVLPDDKKSVGTQTD